MTFSTMVEMKATQEGEEEKENGVEIGNALLNWCPLEEEIMQDSRQSSDGDIPSEQRQASWDEEEIGYSMNEFQTCVKVLNAVGRGSLDEFKRDRFRPLRKSLLPIVKLFDAMKFEGKGRTQYILNKDLELERKARILRKQRHDKKHIDSSALRRTRRENLEKLMEAQDPAMMASLPLIYDGTVVEKDKENIAQPLLLNDSTAVAADVKSSEGNEKCLNMDENALVNQPLLAEELFKARSCYICKVRYNKVHVFYDLLCPSCAELNYAKRHQTGDLSGKVALVTGARVKIGYQTAIKLLTAGAYVIATTRFPYDAQQRYSKHPQFNEFQHRLKIYGMDFRDLVHLESFVQFIKSTYDRMDIIIHNACQTIRRPPQYYSPLINKEMEYKKMLQNQDTTLPTILGEWATHSFDAQPVLTHATTESSHQPSLVHVCSALKSQIPLLESDRESNAEFFPTDLVDVNGQQIDLRPVNSWLLQLGDISTPEMFEVFAINTMAPLLMNNQLLPLMEKTAGERKFVINVSSMEGKFYRYKNSNHPHTNMAKAALNMMTRTCADGLSKKGIYMSSVDTGWINDENPLVKAFAHAQKTGFQTPIDEIDAAARILDPVFTGFALGTETVDLRSLKSLAGKFFKDYHETEW